MHFLGRPQPAPVVLARECEARVLDEIGLKSEITCHPDRRFQRVVRDNAEHDERVDLCEAKQAIELGADKRGSAWPATALLFSQLQLASLFSIARLSNPLLRPSSGVRLFWSMSSLRLSIMRRPVAATRDRPSAALSEILLSPPLIQLPPSIAALTTA